MDKLPDFSMPAAETVNGGACNNSSAFRGDSGREIESQGVGDSLCNKGAHTHWRVSAWTHTHTLGVSGSQVMHSKVTQFSPSFEMLIFLWSGDRDICWQIYAHSQNYAEKNGSSQSVCKHKSHFFVVLPILRSFLLNNQDSPGES